MQLSELKKHWHAFGKRDPLWAILTKPGTENGGWDVDEFFKLGENDIDRLLNEIAALPLQLKRGKALDFGCGVGRLTQALCRHFQRCYGVDIARSMLRHAKRFNKYGRRCRYFLVKRADLSFLKSDQFDLICSFLVLQHINPQYSKPYLRELLRVLAPGGALCFQIPSHWTRVDCPAPRPIERKSGANGNLLKNVIRSIKNRRTQPPFEPVMEMYGIPREEVIRFVAENGGRVLKVAEDFVPDWISCRYYVTK